jgi:hypothetical protein
MRPITRKAGIRYSQAVRELDVRVHQREKPPGDLVSAELAAMSQFLSYVKKRYGTI